MSPGCRLEPYNSASLTGLMSIDVSWLQVNGADTNSVNPVTVFLNVLRVKPAKIHMDERSKFIESHHFVESHQHFSYGTVNPVYQNKVKVRRTSAHLRDISRTSGLTFKGILTPCMDGTLECLWIVE